jgi:uncharacterized delta-60 repeat protein
VTGAAQDTSGNPSTAATASFTVAIPEPEPAIDPNFGNVTATFAAEAAGPAGDGKLIIAGRQGDLAAGTSQLVLQRLNPDGSLDTSFGNGGKVLGAQGANEAAFAVTVDPADNSIVVAGRRGDDLMVSRFKADGSIDTRFGTGGVAIADFGGVDAAFSVALAPDGAIVAAGGSTQGDTDAFAFARFTRTGQADTLFGDGGRALFAQGTGGNVAGAVAVDPTGRIVAAGPSEGERVAVVRLNANGVEDTSFGTSGVLMIPQLVTRSDLDRPDRSIGVVAQPDGSVLVSNRSPGGDFAIAKVRPDGTLDASFSGDGVSTIDFGGDDDADQLLLQGTGEILALGTTSAGGNQLAVAAVGQNGSLITSFGDGGKLVLEATADQLHPRLRVGDLVLRAFGSLTGDGRLVIGGSDQRQAAAVTATPLRRLNVPGSGSLGNFGTVAGQRKPQKLSFPDADGTIVTLSMKGPGTGQAFFDGSAIDLTLSGVNNSTLVITTAGGDGPRHAPQRADGRRAQGPHRKTTDLAGTFSVLGALGKVSLGTLTGTLAASGPIGSATFAGDVKGNVFSGANYGVNGRLGGTGDAADTFSQGRIGKVTVAGAAVGATFAAGVDPVNQKLLDGNDTVIGGAASSIGTVTIKQGADPSTRFIAGSFGKKAKLPQPVDPLTDPRFMRL